MDEQREALGISRWMTGGFSTAGLPQPGYRRDVERLTPELAPDDDALDPVSAYLDDERPAPPGRPWVVVSMVASVDGATAIDGRSAGLGGPGDQRVFRALRGSADMILVGAGTVRAEGYRSPRTPDDKVVARRLAEGRAPRPRLVVVSGSLDLDPRAPLFTDRSEEDLSPIVATVASAPQERRDALVRVAELVACGPSRVDLTGLLAVLDDIGAGIVLCEGGPDLNHQLLAAGLVDEVCLTISPRLVGGTGYSLLSGGPLPIPTRLRLDRVLAEEGFLFCRYLVS